MIKKINNSPGNGDSLKVITDKCNDNFQLLVESIPNVEDILNKKNYLTDKDIKKSFDMSDVKGLMDEIHNLKKINSDLTDKITNLEKLVSESNKASLEAVRVSLDTQKLLSSKQ